VAEYDLIPKDVKQIETKYRSIKTKIPVPESIPIFLQLKKSEPRSMLGQPPIIWHKADNFTIYDQWGNRWIDWSACVLVSNVGHGHEEIRQSLKEIINQGLLASYVFAHEKRVELTKQLQALSPDPENYTVFLLTTGSEATENCIKLSKTYALDKYGPQKKYIISFNNAFHGRTMGAQLAGGIESLKKWMVDRDPSFVQVPFPDGYKNEDVSFDLFLNTIKRKGIKQSEIAGIITESYQGGGPDFLPVEYAHQLAEFCKEFDIVLSFDEVQSGFGRTGKMFCYEHYGVKPDLIACGKGISSSLAISAVIGRKDIMDIYAPGSMTSTHSASPLPVAAAIANLKVMKRSNIQEHALKMGEILIAGLKDIQLKYPDQLGCVQGKGLVAGIQVVKAGSKIPDPDTAFKINLTCFQKGLLMFAPVGVGGECIKISPPLSITEEALRESIDVLDEAVTDVLGI
jgi:4-aminobutyrate aminotransferase-like enzyme